MLWSSQTIERRNRVEKFVSVFLEQDSLKKEDEAKKKLHSAKEKDECVGGRIFAAGRGRDRRFVVQVYFRDDGGSPPVGMARYLVPGAAADDLGIS